MPPIICINCTEAGHMFKDCKHPIISYGVLGFRKNKESDNIEYLLVQRKDTIGYVDFLRGKFNRKISREENYKTLLEEMTTEEKTRLITLPFNKLWDDLWYNHRSRMYINDYNNAKRKFYNIDIYNMVKNTINSWSEQEFCIPKGRKNNKELSFNCAIREFTEETGYKRSNILIYNTENTLEECFLGSNGIMYKHVYILARINDEEPPKINKDNISQVGEIRSVKWFSFKDCINTFRDYETTKRNVLYQARNIINDFYSQS